MLSPLLTQATSVFAVRGEGAYLYGSDGQRYLDFTSGIGVTSTGHCHPKVVAAAQAQAATLIHGQYTTVLHPRLVELSERLETVMPAGIDTFFYASAGTEAVEASLRLVRQATGRPNVIVFQGGFHGRTMGSLSMTTSKTALRAGLQPLMGGVFVTPFPYSFRYGWDEETTVRFCLRELDHLLATQTAPDETAAVYLEPVLGEGATSLRRPSSSRASASVAMPTECSSWSTRSRLASVARDGSGAISTSTSHRTWSSPPKDWPAAFPCRPSERPVR